MKRALLGVVLLAVQGCGMALPQGPPADEFRQVAGTDEQRAHASETVLRMRERIAVDVSRVDLWFMTTWEEQRDACRGFAACTHAEVNGYHVATYWPEPWSWNHAELLAHELCHVYYYQTGENGDPEHTHDECYHGSATEVAHEMDEQR